MLPFRKRQDEASASGPIESQKREPDEGADLDMLEVAAQDLIDALHKKDAKALAAALRAAFELFDSEPHVEGKHTDE